MEFITVNLSKSVRRDTLMGRRVVVAPVTLIVPGVLNGSQGPLRYQADDARKSVAAWNGMPVVVYHPTSGSGRTPETLNKQGIGTLLNVTFDNQLRGEVWLDEERTNSVDNQIIPAILKGEKIEVSTGLNLDKEPAEAGATENGVAYIGTARNYQPDHLAILPTGRGACSTRDGCGINNAESGDMSDKKSAWSKLGEILGITDNATPNPQVTPDKACQIVTDGSVHGQPLSDAQKGMFGAICGKKKKAENCECDGECEYCREAKRIENVAGMSMDDLGEKVRVAFRKLYPRNYTSDSSMPEPRVPYVEDIYDDFIICEKDGQYFKHAYTVADGEVTIDAEAVPVKEVTTYEPIENRESNQPEDVPTVIDNANEGEPVASPVTNSQGDLNMAMTAEQKKTIVDNIIAWNCECGKASAGPKPYSESDRDTLNAMADEKLTHMDECRKAMTKNESIATAAKVHLIVNADGTVAPKDVPVANAAPKPKTDAEWIAEAPESVRRIIQNAQEAETKEKNDIVTRLVANVAENERQSIADGFMKETIEKLRLLDKLIPAKADNESQNGSATRWTAPDYSGAAAPVGNSKSQEQKGEPLYSPSMWG